MRRERLKMMDIPRSPARVLLQPSVSEGQGQGSSNDTHLETGDAQLDNSTRQKNGCRTSSHERSLRLSIAATLPS